MRRFIKFSSGFIFVLIALLAAIVVSSSTGSIYAAGTYYVSTSGDDGNPGTFDAPWRTIQKACDALSSGDTAFVRGGVYKESVRVNVSGTAAAGYITIRNYEGEAPVLEGAGLAAPAGNSSMVWIKDKQYVRIIGLEIRNYKTTVRNNLISGVYIAGTSHHVEIRNCDIHNIENNAPVNADRLGRDAHGIAVYGTSASAPVHHIVVDGNTVSDCVLGSSEAVVVNGNVSDFRITNNVVHDNDNIGIDMIGWEGTSPDPLYDQARNGVCARNTVYNIRTAGNPAYAASDNCADGIYVDGGRDILIERNKVFQCNLGIEVASEHYGKFTEYITVRNNLIFNNDASGLIYGGYSVNRGVTRNCAFVNNTIYRNQLKGDEAGEVCIQKANGNVFKNNIIVSRNAPNVTLLSNWMGASNTYNEAYNNNLWYSEGGGSYDKFIWNNKYYSFAGYKNATGNDAGSLLGNPLFVNGPGFNFNLRASSPAVDLGTTADYGALDYRGKPRVAGLAVDCGALERQ